MVWKHIVSLFPAKCSKMAAKQIGRAQNINAENSETEGIELNESEHQEFKIKKRTNYLQWDEYFMAVAFLSAQRSKDPSSQVGACIVNREKKIVGIGYNGMPNGCSDDILPWARKGDSDLDTKYPYGMYLKKLPFVAISKQHYALGGRAPQNCYLRQRKEI